MYRKLAIALLVAVVLVGVSACGGASTADSTSTLAPTTSTTTLASIFLGDYTMSLTSDDLKSGGADDKTLAGDWVFTLTSVDESTVDYVATLDGTRAWGGVMVIEGDQIMVTTEDVGREGEAEGTYTWTFDGTDLVFSVVSDGLTEREVIFTAHPWVRQP